jgi:release factor glutamine methyltransferase
MLSTPDFSHLTTNDYEKIYEPSEDTFLLLDALEKDMSSLNEMKPLFVFEIGSGSGVVINFLAKHLKESKKCLFYSTDINMDACKATQRTARQNKNDINVVNCDLIMPLVDKMKRKIDILIFNPPYVVTEMNEVGSKGLPAAWAGGPRGRVVMDRLFPYIDSLLTEQGFFYLVCIKQNQIEQIEKFFLALKFKIYLVMERKAGIENLYILRFSRISK